MNTETDEILDRLKIVFNIQSDIDLSKKLNIPKATVSTWRQRDSTPYSLCIQIAKENNISLDWLMIGEGSTYKESKKWDGITERRGNYQVNRDEGSLLAGLTDQQINNVLSEIDEKKRLNRLEDMITKIKCEIEK